LLQNVISSELRSFTQIFVYILNLLICVFHILYWLLVLTTKFIRSTIFTSVEYMFSRQVNSWITFSKTESLRVDIASTKLLFPTSLNGCVTNYLLKLKPEKTSKNNDESVHDIAFSSLVSSIHDDLFLHKKAFLISHLLDKYRSFLPKSFCGQLMFYLSQP
jgi:hypothetical protein